LLKASHIKKDLVDIRYSYQNVQVDADSK